MKGKAFAEQNGVHRFTTSTIRMEIATITVALRWLYMGEYIDITYNKR